MPTPRARNWGPNLRRGFGALWLVALTVLVTPRLAPAQPGGEPSSHQVEVMLVGKAGRDPEFGRRITSWFDAARFRVRVHHVFRLDPAEILSPKPDEAVYAWVLLPRRDRARIYFATTTGPDEQPTYLLRDLSLEQGLDEMGAERVAQVLCLSTVALVDGQAASRRDEVERMLSEEATEPAGPNSTEHPGSARPATPAPESAATQGPDRAAHREPEPSAARSPAVSFEAGVGYGASTRGDEGVWHGPRATLLVRLASGFGVQALVQSALPITRQMQDLELEFYGGLLGIAGSYQHELGRGAKLEWSAGPGLEVVHFRPVRSLSSEITTGRDDTEARPAAVAVVSAIFRDSPPQIVAAVQGAVPLLDSHYDVVTGDDHRVVGRSWPVVPSLGVEARF